jgi:hypothetical protein
MKTWKYFSKKSKNILLLILFLAAGFIVLSIFSLYISSFALESDVNNNNDEFNIITAADFGCSPRAQENIKNIEKFNPELVLVPGDLI